MPSTECAPSWITSRVGKIGDPATDIEVKFLPSSQNRGDTECSRHLDAVTLEILAARRYPA
jgi:hypothetical protein